MQILLGSNPDKLRESLQRAGETGLSTATVEAEYGDVVVEGSLRTLAHHGPRAGAPAPCLFDNQPEGHPDVVGMSHLDLDAIGGVLALLGRKPAAASFWTLAAFVDVNGAHKLGVSGASAEDLRRLYAWWAWNEAHKVYPPRDGSVADVEDEFLRAEAHIRAILSGDEGLLAAGDEFKAKSAKLNAESYVDCADGVVVRVASAFVNHLYDTPSGTEVGRAVVGFNPITGAVTVSLADPIPGVSCREMVQVLWGPEAGGHAGIAGSPRNKRMTFKDLASAVEVVRGYVSANT